MGRGRAKAKQTKVARAAEVRRPADRLRPSAGRTGLSQAASHVVESEPRRRARGRPLREVLRRGRRRRGCRRGSRRSPPASQSCGSSPARVDGAAARRPWPRRRRSRRRAGRAPLPSSPRRHAACGEATASRQRRCDESTTAIMPTPMLNVRSMLGRVDAAELADQIEDRLRRHVDRSTSTCDLVGQHAGEVGGEPAAGDVAKRVHVDARRARGRGSRGRRSGSARAAPRRGVRPSVVDVRVEAETGRASSSTWRASE